MPVERRIGLAVDAVAAYGRGIIRGVMTYAHTNPGWTISVEPQWSFGTVADVEKWDVDGLIVQIYSTEFEDRVIRRGLPSTNVSNSHRDTRRLPTVVPDDGAVARMAFDYLCSLGFRELGYCWSGEAPYGKLRRDAFRALCREANIAMHECDGSTTDYKRWLAGLPKPIGILGCNDDWAHRLLNAAHHQGIKVPDQVAVLGVDNDELFNVLVTPSLSSIALPGEQIGFEAASQLNRMLEGEKIPYGPTLLSPLRVVPRASTDVLSIDDEDIVLAVRYIREHAAESLQVDDVLDHVPLARRSLERRFRSLVGHSISDEIRRAHVERAKQLLVNTDLPMHKVAVASGFTTATRLGIVFHKEVGEPPSQYRRRARLSGPVKV